MDRIDEVKQNIKDKKEIKIVLNTNSIYNGHFTELFGTNFSGRTLAYFLDKNNHRVSVVVEDISAIEHIGGFKR